MVLKDADTMWFLPSALNVKVKKFNQARVNGGSNYDSLNHLGDKWAEPGALVPKPVPVVSRTSGVTSAQVGARLGKPASLVKLFWKALLGVGYRSRRETTGAHPGRKAWGMVTIPTIGVISSQAPTCRLPFLFKRRGGHTGKVQRSNGWAVTTPSVWLLMIRSVRSERRVTQSLGHSPSLWVPGANVR